MIMITLARGISFAKEYVQVLFLSKSQQSLQVSLNVSSADSIQDCAYNFQEGAHKKLMGVARSHFLRANFRKLGSSLWSLSSQASLPPALTVPARHWMRNSSTQPMARPMASSEPGTSSSRGLAPAKVEKADHIAHWLEHVERANPTSAASMLDL